MKTNDGVSLFFPFPPPPPPAPSPPSLFLSDHIYLDYSGKAGNLKIILSSFRIAQQDEDRRFFNE